MKISHYEPRKYTRFYGALKRSIVNTNLSFRQSQPDFDMCKLWWLDTENSEQRFLIKKFKDHYYLFDHDGRHGYRIVFHADSFEAIETYIHLC